MSRQCLKLIGGIVLVLSTSTISAETIPLTRLGTGSQQYAYAEAQSDAAGPDEPWWDSDLLDFDTSSQNLSATAYYATNSAVGLNEASLDVEVTSWANVGQSYASYGPEVGFIAGGPALLFAPSGSAHAKGSGWGSSDASMEVGTPTEDPDADMLMEGLLEIDVSTSAGVTTYDVYASCGGSWVWCNIWAGCIGHIEVAGTDGYDFYEPTWVDGGVWQVSEYVGIGQHIGVGTSGSYSFDDYAPATVGVWPEIKGKASMTVNTLP